MNDLKVTLADFNNFLKNQIKELQSEQKSLEAGLKKKKVDNKKNKK